MISAWRDMRSGIEQDLQPWHMEAIVRAVDFEQKQPDRQSQADQHRRNGEPPRSAIYGEQREGKGGEHGKHHLKAPWPAEAGSLRVQQRASHVAVESVYQS